MPLYDRRCQKCDSLWEVTCKISEKDNAHNCPSCDSTEGEWMISSPNVSMRSERFTGNMDKKTGFHDVVKKISNAYPLSKLKERI